MRDELHWFRQACRAKRLRTMRQFAEDEIVIPDGPFAGRRYRADRQPYTAHWFDAVDSGHWKRFAATGPSQSGKTLTCFVIPILYYLFEVGETVIVGLPDMEMAGDKWTIDIKPVIERTRYAELLPTSGTGSKGGRFESIRFRNGCTLKFMSGGGKDKKRAAFTARVLIITEADGLDETGGTSREADKLEQLEARTRAYGDDAIIFKECTVSIETGRIWREYTAGTESRIVLQCPHCRDWAVLEREHLVGWSDAETEVQARERAAFACPSCGELWSDDERRQANLHSRLIHKGQTVDADGNVAGELPAVETLGFRWSGVHNLFSSSGQLGVDEWKASRSDDEENAERKQRQFVWTLPDQPSEYELVEIAPNEIVRRVADPARGIVPKTSEQLCLSIDLGWYLGHWVLTSWPLHVVDYGTFEVPSEQLGVDVGLMAALRDFRKDVIEPGWPSDAGRVIPGQVWIDAGDQPDVVHQFVEESGAGRYRAVVGRGGAQVRQQKYNRPKSTGATVKRIGEGYHIARLARGRELVEIDADHWKSYLRARLTAPVGEDGALTLFQAVPREHLAFARHLTAEKPVEEFVAGRGLVTRWHRVRRANHWLDGTTYTLPAHHLLGARLLENPQPPPPPAPPASPRPRLTMPDGRPYLITERD